MRIIASGLQARAAPSPPAPAPRAAGDRLGPRTDDTCAADLSSVAQLHLAAQVAYRDNVQERLARVASLRQAVQAGQYQVDRAGLAQALARGALPQEGR